MEALYLIRYDEHCCRVNRPGTAFVVAENEDAAEQIFHTDYKAEPRTTVTVEDVVEIPRKVKTVNGAIFTVARSRYHAKKQTL